MIADEPMSRWKHFKDVNIRRDDTLITPDSRSRDVRIDDDTMQNIFIGLSDDYDIDYLERCADVHWCWLR